MVRLVGSADIDRIKALRLRLREATEEIPSLLVLDLSALTFVCSHGLGAFIEAYRRCHDRGGVVRVAAPTEPILEILETTRLTQIMPVFASVDQAAEGP